VRSVGRKGGQAEGEEKGKKTESLCPIHSFCLFLVSTWPSKWRGQKGGELDRGRMLFLAPSIRWVHHAILLCYLLITRLSAPSARLGLSTHIKPPSARALIVLFSKHVRGMLSYILLTT
jgi:hypothetical protein